MSDLLITVCVGIGFESGLGEICALEKNDVFGDNVNKAMQ
jgi:hypothetical protein